MSRIEPIDAATLKSWLDKGDVTLIDVREPGEHAQAHIAGSILIPVGTCATADIPHDPAKKLVFYCKAGKRGGMACQICASSMPEGVVYNLSGGIDEWIAEGYEVQ
ncbi:MAG: rhodanese-like domain-containing protein [Alphaproteobacteria bacterium]|nr:rhodanese-like domain-containing protein [Alphaproteobacteria bacterium]